MYLRTLDRKRNDRNPLSRLSMPGSDRMAGSGRGVCSRGTEASDSSLRRNHLEFGYRDTQRSPQLQNGKPVHISPGLLQSGERERENTCEHRSLIGSPLTAADLTSLESRWIDRQSAESACLRRVDSFTGSEIVGRRSGDYSGIVIPYFSPASKHIREYRLRRDHPDREVQANGEVKVKQKYLSPPGRANMLYLAPGWDAADLQNAELPLILTEGEFKTLALSRLSKWNSSAGRQFLPIGIAGVFNWRGVIGKTTSPDGQRVSVRGPIPDLDWLVWEGRKVVIAFDSDAASNDLVSFARRELAQHLRRRGAQLGFYEWSLSEGKGIDDYLASVGPEVVLQELSRVSFHALNWREELLRSKPSPANKQGTVYPVLANAISALRYAPEWKDVLAFNEFDLMPTAIRATPWSHTAVGQSWTDQEDRLTADWLQRNGILVDVGIAAQAAQTVAQDRTFHPVRNYLERIAWDGIQRLDRWAATYLGSEDTNYTRAVGARWLLSAIARIYRPGVKADCCLILEGPQGSKKSTALKTLAGPYFTDELADLGSKDSALQTRGVWIIELSELDTLSRSDVSRIKAFMSRTTDRFRPPYGKRLIESPRQCIFAGTVNHSTYLRDDTGARRFWPLVCGTIDIGLLERDRDQIWAEAKARFDQGCAWWLDNQELEAAAAEQQADRFESDPWQELLASWIEKRSDASVSETLSCCLDKPRAQWMQADKNRVARCFRALGWERYRERQGNTLEWRYRRVEG
jgi:predicted P-loop ATPase